MAPQPTKIERATKIGKTESAEIARRRKLRNWAVLVVLVALSALFYAITIVKLMTPH